MRARLYYITDAVVPSPIYTYSEMMKSKIPKNRFGLIGGYTSKKEAYRIITHPRAKFYDGIRYKARTTTGDWIYADEVKRPE